MKRWVGTILLISFIRLQLACCCGSVGHFEPAKTTFIPACQTRCSAESSEAHSECHHSFDEHPHHDHEVDECRISKPLESASTKSATLSDAQVSSTCECCHQCGHHDHHHHLYILKHGLVTSVNKVTIDSLILVHAFPDALIFDSCVADWSECPSADRALPFFNVSVLEVLGQLRI